MYITINEFNSESDFRNEVLLFIINYLGIKSKINLLNKLSSFNKDTSSQNMAGVSFPNGNIFDIYINFEDTKTGFVRRLAHELIHVKQIEEGRLKQINKNTISFDGVNISYIDYKKQYHEDPPAFELEAFEKERIIANSYWNSIMSP